MMQIMIIVAMVGIAALTVLNLQMLFWNLSSFRKFSKTDAYITLKNSSAETTILAMPLAIVMSINAAFIVGLVFVPGLRGVIEYLFPLALIACVRTVDGGRWFGRQVRHRVLGVVCRGDRISDFYDFVTAAPK